ncbi:MAG: 2-oxoacid:acceptor oxidoreductase family protein [Synergistaceae bacterium]|jgi:2-oxoglutarate ferredoxin oxidoreductase subunit gamma|nr:2-oxoacid:acceptor oxidoreductase family protein [Synergistaceae bacterium]
MKPISIRFSGFGGQGIILSAVVLGDALVIHRGLYAAQTQSYGSEARGGQCQSELMVSEEPILTPIRASNDILVSMFQTSLDSYIGFLRRDGTLFVDSGLVADLSRVPPETTRHAVPATEIALALGNKMAANMVMLGYFAGVTKMLNLEQLDRALGENVRKEFLDLNKKAIRTGFDLSTGKNKEIAEEKAEEKAERKTEGRGR